MGEDAAGGTSAEFEPVLRCDGDGFVETAAPLVLLLLALVLVVDTPAFFSLARNRLGR